MRIYYSINIHIDQFALQLTKESILHVLHMYTYILDDTPLKSTRLCACNWKSALQLSPMSEMRKSGKLTMSCISNGSPQRPNWPEYLLTFWSRANVDRAFKGKCILYNLGNSLVEVEQWGFYSILQKKTAFPSVSVAAKWGFQTGVGLFREKIVCL